MQRLARSNVFQCLGTLESRWTFEAFGLGGLGLGLGLGGGGSLGGGLGGWLVCRMKVRRLLGEHSRLLC